MKIALISSIFGGMDAPHNIVEQEGVEYGLFHYTESNSPYPFPNLNDRLKAKYFKCQSHRIPELMDYNLHCWIDGSVEVVGAHMLKDFSQRLIESGADVGIGAHNMRECIYDEAETIVRSKDPYLTDRYKGQFVAEEVEQYRKDGHPEKWGLFSCGIWIRHNNEKVNGAWDWWWNQCLTWSYLDQTAFPFIMRREGINLVDLNYGDVMSNEYFKLIPHKKTQ